MKPVHISKPYFCNISINIIVPFTPHSSLWVY